LLTYYIVGTQLWRARLVLVGPVLALAEIVATRIDFFLAGRWGALCGFRPERRPENKMVLLLHTKGAHHQNICGNGETEPATKNQKDPPI
jgi:hypothetical protein